MSYTIITSNIRFDNSADGKHSWDGRKQVLWNLLNNHGADLLGSQEAREPQLRNFAEGLEDLEMVCQHREWIEERMYPCIYVNPATVEVLESGDIWLSETPSVAGSKSFDSAFPRLCTWIKGRFRDGRGEFLYVNTHLDHMQEKTRVEQARILVEEVQNINIGNLPIILTGDFNTDPNSSVRTSLWELKLHDPWAKFGHAEMSSHHKFDGDETQGSRIDWILFDGSFACSEIKIDKSSAGEIWPSDHFPVIAKFS